MAEGQFKIKISVSWWFSYLYLPGLRLVSILTNRQADPDKVLYYFRKAVFIKEGAR